MIIFLKEEKMSGPVAMYTLKPIMPIVNLSKQNKVMYEMNNIHEIQQKIIVDEKENETIVTEIKDQVTKILKVFFLKNYFCKIFTPTNLF